MKSIYDTSTCPECNGKIGKGVEINKNSKGQWSHAACIETQTVQKEIVSDTKPVIEVVHPDEEVDPYKSCIDGCVRAAEFFKSIDYPKELWNLSTIWNTERIKKK